MKTADFDYNLPKELIAQKPLPDRSASRMMVVRRDNGRLEHRHVTDLPEYLEPGDLLVVNDTRVIPARVFGHRTDTGGRVELLLIEEVERTNPQSAIRNPQSIWDCLYHASRPPRVGMRLLLAEGKLKAEITGAGKQGRVTIKLASNRPLLDILEEEGFAPVPPYIKRNLKEKNEAFKELDRKRYQTVYARNPGAVAAPTAGLHFTSELLAQLEKRGIRRTAVTLHVGPGTFKPIKTELVEDHSMEQERYVVGKEAVEVIGSTRKAGGRIVAVGSTTVRALETVMSEKGAMVSCSGRSSLFIYPPYQFKIVDVMLTNFHLPMSTLIMMVSAFGGKDLIFCAYREAIRLNYRFYSYGDCMLIL